MSVRIATAFLFAAVAAVTLGGCIKNGAFACATDDQCGPGGRCETTVGFCSFADPECGRRFGEASGPFSNQCVGGGGGDGGIDSPGDGQLVTDAPIDVPTTACAAMTVLFGTDDITGSVTDSIPASIIDAFGYDVSQTVVVSCAWVYVEGAPSGDIRVGVYSDMAGNPRDLLAQATIQHPSGNNRWTSAPLDTSLTLMAGTTRWIGVITTTGNLTTPIQSSCGNGQHPLHNDTQVSDLSNPFAVNQTFTTCAAPFFLGP